MTTGPVSARNNAPQSAEQPECVGECNRAHRRASEAGKPHPRPAWVGRPVWCVDEYATNPNGDPYRTHTGCSTLIRDALAEVPLLLARLPASGPLTAPHDRADDEPHGSNPDPPSPSPAWDERDEVTRWLYRLEDTTRARLGHTPAAVPRRPDTAAGYLVEWTTALLADPDTAEHTGRQIRATARRLAWLTGSDQLTIHIPGPCPNTRCGRAGRRTRRDGSDLIVCGACGLTETMDAHEDRADRLLTELRRRGLREAARP